MATNPVYPEKPPQTEEKIPVVRIGDLTVLRLPDGAADIIVGGPEPYVVLFEKHEVFGLSIAVVARDTKSLCRRTISTPMPTSSGSPRQSGSFRQESPQRLDRSSCHRKVVHACHNLRGGRLPETVVAELEP